MSNDITYSEYNGTPIKEHYYRDNFNWYSTIKDGYKDKYVFYGIPPFNRGVSEDYPVETYLEPTGTSIDTMTVTVEALELYNIELNNESKYQPHPGSSNTLKSNRIIETPSTNPHIKYIKSNIPQVIKLYDVPEDGYSISKPNKIESFVFSDKRLVQPNIEIKKSSMGISLDAGYYPYQFTIRADTSGDYTVNYTFSKPNACLFYGDIIKSANRKDYTEPEGIGSLYYRYTYDRSSTITKDTKWEEGGWNELTDFKTSKFFDLNTDNKDYVTVQYYVEMIDDSYQCNYPTTKDSALTTELTHGGYISVMPITSKNQYYFGLWLDNGIESVDLYVNDAENPETLTSSLYKKYEHGTKLEWKNAIAKTGYTLDSSSSKGPIESLKEDSSCNIKSTLNKHSIIITRSGDYKDNITKIKYQVNDETSSWSEISFGSTDSRTINCYYGKRYSWYAEVDDGYYVSTGGSATSPKTGIMADKNLTEGVIASKVKYAITTNGNGGSLLIKKPTDTDYSLYVTYEKENSVQTFNLIGKKENCYMESVEKESGSTSTGPSIDPVSEDKTDIKLSENFSGSFSLKSNWGLNPELYLTFTAESGDVSVTPSTDWNATTKEYSTNNGTNWSTYTSGSITGSNVKLRGLGGTSGSAPSGWTVNGNNVSISGNIETILDYRKVMNGEHPKVFPYLAYYRMFKGCTSITDASSLSIPFSDNNDTILCCAEMFYGCTSLKNPPILPAKKAVQQIYAGMFYGCTSLETAPELPATTLDLYCYRSMFEGCTSLTTAPELPATTLSSYCYDSMFMDCSSLTTAPELPATTLKESCYSCMLYGCKSLKFSETKTDMYSIPYRIPVIGTGTTASNWNDRMFSGTGGTFTGDPSINTTYYTTNKKECPVGGRIFYVDSTSSGATYTFYDKQGNVLSTQTVEGLANAYKYEITGTPSKNKFYVYDSTNGLSEGNKEWGAYKTLVGITSDGIGLGKTNTATALANPDCHTPYTEENDTVWTYLTNYINYNVGGCNDWFIGTPAEQDLLRNSGLVDWYTSNYIWSSVEDNDDNAYVWTYYDSQWSSKPKVLDLCVIPIRAF